MMKIACKYHNVDFPIDNPAGIILFSEADVPVEVPDRVAEQLLKHEEFYNYDKRKRVQRIPMGSSFVKYEEVEDGDDK